jgi:hypothetical protein
MEEELGVKTPSLSLAALGSGGQKQRPLFGRRSAVVRSLFEIRSMAVQCGDPRGAGRKKLQARPKTERLNSAPFPSYQVDFSWRPGAVKVARSAPGGLGLDGEDRCEIVRLQGKGADRVLTLPRVSRRMMAAAPAAII